jgi:hypothetical protein
MDRRKHIRRGFSLVEAAIVLGVVGLVIGGIWYSAAKFYEDYKVNKTVADLQLIVKNIQGLISCRDSIAIGSVNITTTVVNAGGLPKDWVGPYGITENPFGGIAYIANEVGTHECIFGIELHKIPPSSCIKLVVKEASMAAMVGNKNASAWNGTEATENRPNLARIRVNIASTPDWVTDSFPVSLQEATTACYKPLNRIYFYYSYTRIN